jgi:hypothetical protein
MLPGSSDFARISLTGRTTESDLLEERRLGRLPIDTGLDRPPIDVDRPAIDVARPIDVDTRPPFQWDDIRFPPDITLPLPPPGDPDIPRFSGPQTTTLLVSYAIEYLEGLPAETLRSALSFLQAKPQKVAPAGLFEDLRQRTSFDEVLREKAQGWKQITRQVFAEVFAMPADNLAAMDAIVCIALLNRPDLEQALRAENAAPPTIQQLLENRRIVWQYPPPGTPLTPPYVIVVAVESTDTGPAEDVVSRIMSSLVVVPSGYRLPRLAAEKAG